MTRIKYESELPLDWKEGNPGSITLTIPSDIISLDGRTLIFEVRDTSGRLIIQKTDEISIAGEVVDIPLEYEDTFNKVGKHRWGLDTDEHLTLEEGDFTIFKKIVRG